MGRTKPFPSNDEEPIVAIGLLTQNDLNLLGSGFRRAFRVDESPDFDDLLAAIDAADAGSWNADRQQRS
jgi:hypothetical protein